ncbi:MAG: hypothetical protein ACD_33C00035G0001, partial [uncultured bacterium]
MCDEIIRKEVRFAVHIPKTTYREDYHYVKLVETCKCGKITPKIVLLKDYKRDVYITKKIHQNHKEKKEFEDLDKLSKQECTQSDLNKTVANLLGKSYLISTPNEIKNSPYIYGYDITSTSYIKLKSLHKNNFIQSGYSVAVLDIENDVVTKEILMITIVMSDKIYTAVLKKFIGRCGDHLTRIKNAITEYIPMYKDLAIEVEVFDKEVDMIKKTFKIANQWKPDLLAIWNMDYDIPFILDRLEYYHVNPIDVLCDQTIPRELRICRYKQGIKKKITASGVVKPINPSMQWHTLILTASFYVIDAMCVYRQLRLSQQEEGSYSLDNILGVNKIQQKLKFKEADNYKGIKWHIFMQENYPIEYTVYNIYDCLSILELDKKNKDLTNTLPSFAGITDFNRFNSNPKKIVDALFIFGLDKNRVIGTVPKINKKEEEIESDEIELNEDAEEGVDVEEDVTKYKTLSLKQWILTLPQHLLVYDGLCCIEEYPNLKTNIRGLTYDADVSSSYPSCTLVCNVSKETTLYELIDIEGVKEEIFRMQNLGFILGSVNMLEYFNEI